MSTFDLLPELAAELDRLVPLDPRPGDWSDVVRRAGPPRRFSRMPSRGRFVLLVGALLVLLVAVASATYLLLHDQPAPRPHSGALTVTAGGYNVEIIEVRPGGRTVVVWRCPAGIACGQPEGVDWSPDGRHVAFTLAAINGGSPSYLGLHILDIDTGRDIRLVGEHEPGSGCPLPAAVAWSPDGKTLAYDCSAFRERSRIWLVAADGSHRRRLPTGDLDASWPTWSPGGTHLAFVVSRSGVRNGIYIVGGDGAGLRRVVTHGSAPDWSPDGRVIAYRTPHGVRLVTPAGRDVTPFPGDGIGPFGAPAWSPDGRTIAIAGEGDSGLYLVDKDGRHLRRVRIQADVDLVGPRPAWYPLTEPTSPTGCETC